MQKPTEFTEALVSETGAVIPVDALRAAGVQHGDRVAFVRTSRRSLVVVPATSHADGPSLRTVIGINPRPPGMSMETDQAFLREIRSGDEDL